MTLVENRELWSAGVLLTAILLIRLSSAAELVAEEVIPIAGWQDPPRSVRPVARWWWPGGSVDPQVLERQLKQIKEAGFGAVELQPLLLGLGAEDLAADSKLRTVRKPAFRRLVAGAVASAARNGLAFDLTLGSGWPGGLPTGKDAAERQLLMATLDIEGPGRFQGARAELSAGGGMAARCTRTARPRCGDHSRACRTPRCRARRYSHSG